MCRHYQKRESDWTGISQPFPSKFWFSIGRLYIQSDEQRRPSKQT